MSTKRTASRRGKATTEDVRSGLDSEEEKVLRMRFGLVLPDDQPLPQKGAGRPDVEARLREIERRAFEMSGRLAALRAEAGVGDEDEAETGSAKQKIVKALKAGSSKDKGSTTSSPKTKPSKKRR